MLCQVGGWRVVEVVDDVVQAAVEHARDGSGDGRLTRA